MVVNRVLWEPREAATNSSWSRRREGLEAQRRKGDLANDTQLLWQSWEEAP